MIELFLTGATPLPTNHLIEYIKPVTETQIVEQIQVTWRDNPNGCTEGQWIASEEPFYCIEIPRTVNTTQNTQSVVRVAQNASNAPSGWFPKGQCTWWVASKRAVGQWNNASDWLWQAKRDGWSTGLTPRAGAIAWKYGHVAFTEKVDGDMMLISEANYDYKGSIRTIWVPVSSYSAFIY